jgi:hypothetical protein
VQFHCLDQTQKVDLQSAEHHIGLLHGKYPLSFQYIVEMGLGDSGEPRQSALSGRTAPHSLSEFLKETLLQVIEGHCWA